VSAGVRNLIVTGIPRSGTTLVSALIDSLDDAVCLSEPDWQDSWPREMHDRVAYAERLCEDFARVRRVLLADGEVPDRRQADGSAVTNYFPRSSQGGRTRAYTVLPLRRPGLSGDFLLGMKQNAHYSCVLPELAGQTDFAILAIIRDPVATILSWRSTDLPISEGRLPAAERFWPEIAELATATDDVLLRQVLIYRIFCERYQRLRDRVRLLRYEELIGDPSMLTRTFARQYVRQVSVRQDDVTPAAADVEKIRAYLRAHCPIAEELYPNRIG
jgi:hypothetical protein